MVKAVGQITIIDLNDAIIAGTKPPNPTVGALWIKDSVTPNQLFKWDGKVWIPQELSLELLDPAKNDKLEESSGKVDNLDKVVVPALSSRVDVTEGKIVAKAEKTDVDALKNRVTKAESELTIQADSIKSKVSKLDYDEMQGIVTKQQSSIDQMSDSIAQKVTYDSYNELTNEVSQQETKILQTVNDISLLASKSESTDGRLSTAEASLKLNSDAISLKAEKSDVYTKAQTNTELGKKVDTTTMNNKLAEIKVTTDGITQRVSSTETKVDTATGNVTSLKSDVSALQQDATQIKSTVTGVQQSVTGVDNRLKSAETQVLQNKEAISLKASSTDVYTKSQTNTELGKKVDTTIYNAKVAEIKVETDKITSSVSNLSTDVGLQKKDIATVTQKANSIESSVSTLTNTVTTQGQTMTSQGTSISQLNQSIALKADSKNVYTKTEADGKVSSAVNTAKAEIKLTTDGISQSVSNVEGMVSDIQIGGRNFLEKSDKEVFSGTYAKAEHTYWGSIQHVFDKLNVGDEIVISFDVEMAKGLYLMVYNSNKAGSIVFSPKTFHSIGTEKNRLFFQSKVIDNKGTINNINDTWLEFYSTYGTEDWYTISNVKIEKGNKPTDWTPAPEDIDSSFETVRSSISAVDQKADGITQTVTSLTSTVDSQGKKITSAETTIAQHTNSINLKANTTDVYKKSEVDTNLGKKVDTTTYNKKMSSIDLDINGITQTVTDNKTTISGLDTRVSTSESKIIQNADAIKTKVSSTDFSDYQSESGTSNSWKISSTRIATTGWYRIASNAGNRAFAQFIVKETSSGKHSTAIFNAGIHYGKDAQLTLTGFSNYGSLGVPKARIVYASTYDNPFLELYIVNPSDVEVYCGDNVQSSGWGKIGLTEGSIPNGYVSIEYDLNRNMVVDVTSQNTSKDTSNVNGIPATQVTTRLSSAETNITQNANAIKLKAEKSQVDTISGKVDIANAELAVQAGQISQRVTKTEYDEAVGLGKWIATKYEVPNVNFKTTPPTFTMTQGLTPSSVLDYDDTQIFKAFTGDYFIAHYFTNVFMNVAKTITLTVSHDDSGAIYLNGAEVYSKVTTGGTVALVLRKGWNTIDILNGEYTGAEQINIGVKLSSVVDKLTAHIGIGDKNDTRLTQAETSIVQTKDAIKLKADSTVVTSLGNRVSTTEGSIQVLDTAIKSKVNQTDFNKYSQRVTESESSITQLKGEITQKVSKVDYDLLNKSVNDQATVIQQLNETISLKVDEKVINGIDQRVSEQGTEISLAKDSILLKANKTELDSVTGRLTKAEATLVVQTDKISQTVSKADADSYIGGVKRIRYIRDYLNGSTANGANHWVEIKAMAKGVNVAKNAVVTSSSGSGVANLQRVTDDNITSSLYVSITGNNAYVEVDLGSVVEGVEYIQVWHFYSDGRTYYDTKTEVSEDGVLWRTVFNSEISGTYKETVDGNVIPLDTGGKLADLDKRVDTAETSIVQTANAITSKADKSTTYTKTEVDGKVSLVATDLSTFKEQTATGFTQKANSVDVYTKAQTNTELGKKANQTDVTAVTATVSDMSSDLKVTPVEKSALKLDWDRIKAEYEQVLANAKVPTVAVSTTAFTNTYNALNSTSPKIEAEILLTMGTTYTFSKTALRDAFKNKMSAYFVELEKIRKAINDKITGTANTANNTANGLKDTTIPSLVTRIVTAESAITQTSKEIGLKVTKDEFNAGLSDTQKYVQSRGESLVTNGTGLLGDNTNFSTWRFDGTQAFAGAGSFFSDGQNYTKFSDEIIPVDPSVKYRGTIMAKSLTGLGRNYFGLLPIDIDKLNIESNMMFAYQYPVVSLAKDLKVGDTKVYLTSVDGFLDNQGDNSHQHSIAMWGYTNKGGYEYPESTYTRYTFVGGWLNGAIDRVAKTITLSKPWDISNKKDPSGVFKVGHKLSKTNNGSGYLYTFGSNVKASNTDWQEFQGTITGYGSSSNRFPFGTAYVRLLFLINRNSSGGVAGDNLWISSVDFRSIDQEENAKEYTSQEVSRAKSEIKVTTDGITQSVSSVSGKLSGIESTVASHETQIKQTATDISLNVVKKGNVLASFNASTEGIKLKADKIDMTGVVNINALDAEMKDKIGNSLSSKENYNGVKIDILNGIVATRGDNRIRTMMNATDGFKIQRSPNGKLWQDVISADVNGIVTARGLVIDNTSTIDGIAVPTLVANANKGVTALVSVDKWKTVGKTTINGGHIETGTILANMIAADQLVVGENVKMGNTATISWSKVSGAPTIPTTASQVGALPSGTKATDIGGLASDSTMLTYITSTGVYTGTVSADKIVGNEISGKTIRTSSATQNFLHMQNQVLDFWNDSLNKMKIGFEQFAGQSAYSPYIKMGSGDAYNKDIMRINKLSGEFNMSYSNNSSRDSEMSMTYNGDTSLIAGKNLHLRGDNIYVTGNHNIVAKFG